MSHTWYGNRTECNIFDKDGVMTHFPIYCSEGQLLHLSENTRLISQIDTADTFPVNCSNVGRGSCFDDRLGSNSTLYHILDITNTQWGQETRLQGRFMWPHPRNGGVGHNNKHSDKQRGELKIHKQKLTRARVEDQILPLSIAPASGQQKKQKIFRGMWLLKSGNKDLGGCTMCAF